MNILKRKYRKLFISICVFCLILASFPPLPASAAESQEAKLFIDDFDENSLARWTIYESGDSGNRGKWSTSGNEIPNIDGNRWTWSNSADKKMFVSGSTGAKAIAAGTAFTDLVLEADLQVGGLPGSTDATGLIFRATNIEGNKADGYYGYYVGLRVDRKLQLGKVDATNGWQELVLEDVPWSRGHLKVEAIGNFINIYLNEQLIISYLDEEDPIINSGAIGVRTYWGTSSIDNIHVREVSDDTPQSPSFSVTSGVYDEAQQVELIAEFGTTIRYTLDGSEPTLTSAAYSAPIEVQHNNEIKAIAINGDGLVSETASELIIIAKQTLLADENFDSENVSRWITYHGLNQNSSWSVTDGKYAATKPRGDRAILTSDNISNFIMEAVVNFEASGQSSGLFFRASENGTGADKANGYFTGIHKNGFVEIGKLNAEGDGSWTELAREVAPVYENADNHLKVIALGSQFYFYVNDTLVSSFRDSEHESGLVGLRAWHDNGTVAYDGLKVELLLPVSQGDDVSSVELDEEELQMEIGETYTLTAAISPPTAENQAVSWGSSNRGIVTVNSQGVVKALSDGTATVTVTTADGGKTDSVEVTVARSTQFKNPIVPVSSGAGSADPSIVFHDGYYYYVKSDRDASIVVAKSKRLQDIGTAPRVTVYTPPSGTKYSKGLWAPEIQFIQGKWYIYFAADDGNNANHRMYALESKTGDAQGEYIFRGKVSDPTDKWAIDGAVLETESGLYFVWSGWEGNVDGRQDTYIASMSNPYTIDGERIKISTPDQPWETNETPLINEGPQPLVNKDGKVFIVYSASGSWSDTYTLGLLTLKDDGDVLNPNDWVKSGPIFTYSAAAEAFGTGHNNFTISPDGTEEWHIYHAGRVSGGSWGNRSVRAQPFTWNSDGTPNFGTPAKYGELIDEPSGTPDVIRAEYEAEDAIIAGNAKVRDSGNASGSKVVGSLDRAGEDSVLFYVNAEEAGDYNVTVMYANGSDGGFASHTVTVNDEDEYIINYDNYGWERYNPAHITVKLEQGENAIKLSKRINFAEVDRLIIDLLEQDDNAAIQAVKIDTSSVEQSIGDDATVKVSLRPVYAANQALTITSSNEQVATAAVTSTNKALGEATVTIHAVAEGKATISIAGADNPEAAATVDVTVRGLSQEPDLTGYTVEQFNGEGLADHWSIIKENKANWSLTQNPGFLTIHTTSTDLYESNNSQDNVFLSDLVSADDSFEVILKLEAEVSQNHQQAGLIVWQNADNFVKLAHVADNGLSLESAYELNAKYMKPGNMVKHPGGHTHTLKIKKVGDMYTTYYWNGYEWIQAADPINAKLDTVKVGFYANNIVSNQRIYAKFDYFAVRKLGEGVELEPSKLQLNIGETAQLRNANESNASLKWESSHPHIAAVDQQGLVTAVGPGRMMIKATTASGDLSDTVLVTVLDSKPATGVLYEEDFDGQELEGWAIYGGTWTLSEGGYSVNSGPGNKAIIDDFDFTDFVFEADVTVTSGNEAGLIFRVSEPGVGADALEGYYVGINARSKHAILGYFTNNSWKEIASKKLPIEYDEAYPIKIIVNEGHIQAYVQDNVLNDQPYPKFDVLFDQHLTTGKIGLRAHQAEAVFDNVRVSAYEETVTGETYTNSVMPGIADPHVLYYDGVYYLYGTHTADWPNMVNGIKVYTSPDLVNWTEQPGWALHRDDSWGENRFWAPEVIERDGKFYMYYAVEEHLAVATSDSPLGPFKQEEKRPMSSTKEIDAHIYTDDDGTTYIYMVRFNNNNELWVAKMNDDMLTYDESTLQFVFAATQDWEKSQKPPVASINEGPFVVKHKDTYYMTYSGNHFESPDYGVGYATSDSPLGPWKKYEYNPIMKSNLVVPGAGHHSLIYTPDKSELFMVYHAHNDVGVTEPRKLAIDRVQFVPNPNGGSDIMEVWGPTLTPQPMPANGTEPQPQQGVASITGITQAKVGSSVALIYSLKDFANPSFTSIYAQDMTVQYDPAHLTFSNAMSLRGNDLIVSAEEQSPGNVRILAASKGAALDVNGQWLQLNFTAKASTTGNTAVTLSNIVVANKAGKELEVASAAHELKIETNKSPGPGSPPTGNSGAPVDQDVVIKDGTAIVTFDKKNRTKSISLEQLKDAALLLQAEEASLHIPAEVLAELIKQAGTSNLQGATVEVTVSEAASGILQAPVAGSRAETNQAGPAYQFTLQLKTADGNKISLENTAAGMQLTLDYENGFDQELLGIYHYNEATKQWKYVGGIVNRDTGQITATIHQLGSYAVFEFKKAFDDVAANHWAARALQVLAAKHIVNGTSDTSFTPNGKTTRAEFTGMLVRMLGLSTATGATPFTDVASDKWYAADIAIAYEAGLIQGVSSQQFAPDANITREQMAALLVRAYEKLHGSIDADGTEYAEFADSEQVSGWAQGEISKAIAAGLMQGKGKGMFDPNNNALRAETAQAMYNLLQLQ